MSQLGGSGWGREDIFVLNPALMRVSDQLAVVLENSDRGMGYRKDNFNEEELGQPGS